MISNSISKIKLFMSGIISRLKENSEYFIEIETKYKSGLKEFIMLIKPDDNGYLCDYLGNQKIIDSDSIISVITDELYKYESVDIIYKDRISGIVLSCDGKNVTSKNLSQNEIEVSKAKSTVGGRNYIIKENQAPELLKAIGVMADNNKIKNDMIRKYNQIDRFIELISDIEMSDNITIMDCACGKSYLSFVVNYYYTELLKKRTFVYGIDYNENVIRESDKIKNKLGYNNMKFIKADLKEFTLEKDVDMVISLHACDVATDYAIYSGIKNHAKAIICVPCCHKELSHQVSYEPFSDMLKHGIFKRRFCDILTDYLRSLILEAKGYKVSVIEYISPLETPKNIMLKAIKVSDENNDAWQRYEEIKRQFNVFPKLEELLLYND